MGKPEHSSQSGIASLDALRRRQRVLASVMEGLDPDQRDYVAALSNSLLEPDIFSLAQQDPAMVGGLVVQLQSMNFTQLQIRRVLNLFNLPYQTKR